MSLKVSSLHVSGLDKTKPSSIEPLFESVQNSTDFPSLVSASDELRKCALESQCFSNMQMVVEFNKDNKEEVKESLGSGNVFLKFKEKGAVVASFGVESTNGREISGKASGSTPNLLGKMDLLTFEASMGSEKSFLGTVDWNLPLLFSSKLGANFKVHRDYKSHVYDSSYGVLSRGFAVALTGLNLSHRHLLSYGLAWRDIYPQVQHFKDRLPEVRGPSSSILHDSSPSVISALTYRYTNNNLDKMFFPTKGHLTKFSLELAGMGGDVSHIKPEFACVFVKPVSLFGLFNFTLHSAAKFGFVYPLNNRKVGLADRYTLQNSFLRGMDETIIGPKDKGDSLGGEVFFAGKIAAEFDFPYLSDFGVRLHVFANEGSVNSFGALNRGLSTHMQSSAAAIGVGICIPTPFGRIELNTSRGISRGLHLSAGINSDEL